MPSLYDYIRSKLSSLMGSRGSNADFDEICSRLVEDKRMEASDDFHDICSSFKIGERRLDNMLYECIGMSGDDLLVSFRSRKPHIPL